MSRLLLFAVRLMVPIGFLLQPLSGGDLRVGASAVEITPPEGAPMAGYYYNRAAEGVHDPLLARALVFEEGDTRLSIVVCDLSGLPKPTVDQARRLIEETSRIPADHIMISATHTHTGPVILRPGVRYNLEGEMLRIAREYVDQLPSKIAESVSKALAVMGSAKVAAALGEEDSLTFNRRFHMTDGTIGWNPGKLNPKIIKPAGPIDAEVPVVYFSRENAEPLATYVNYALHLDTVGGLYYSADYPYTLGKQLGEVKGPEMVTLFTIGCAGNLNHIDVKSPDRQKGHGEAARIGTVLAAEVLKSYKKLEPVETTPIQAASRIVKLPLDEIKPSDVEWAKKVAETFGRDDAAPFLDLVNAFKILDVADRNGAPIETEVQVISLGDQVAWVALSGEIFTELGLAIKLASPFQYTIVVELANGSVGYVPNRKSYPEGAYEVISARCGAGSGELLVDTATRVLVDLHRNAVNLQTP
jgi:hypothetical protein